MIAVVLGALVIGACIKTLWLFQLHRTCGFQQTAIDEQQRAINALLETNRQQQRALDAHNETFKVHQENLTLPSGRISAQKNGWYN